LTPSSLARHEWQNSKCVTHLPDEYSPLLFACPLDHNGGALAALGTAARRIVHKTSDG